MQLQLDSKLAIEDSSCVTAARRSFERQAVNLTVQSVQDEVKRLLASKPAYAVFGKTANSPSFEAVLKSLQN